LTTGVAAFDISLGCSGYVYGLFVLKGFLEASGLSNGILVTADPYSKIIDPADRVTSLLFGDAATATWLGENPAWKLDGVGYGTNGGGAEYLCKRQKRLHMNGRQIFNFANMQVAPHIRNLLDKQGLDERDIDLYCMHQGSAAIVNAIGSQFPAVFDRFVVDMLETGNTVSSSIPLLLETRAFDDNVKRILLSGFGVGLSWASAIISKNSDKG
jgi:3-oxoacyl-[acyl-carrier-protein] synthase-3